MTTTAISRRMFPHSNPNSQRALEALRSAVEAIRDVAAGRVERVAAPGKWRVWRGDDGRVKFEVME